MSAMDMISEFVKFPGFQGDMDVADEVLIRLNIDVYEGTAVPYHDATVLALTCHALASELHRLRTESFGSPETIMCSECLTQSIFGPFWMPSCKWCNGTGRRPVAHASIVSPLRHDDIADDARDMQREHERELMGGATCGEGEEE